MAENSARLSLWSNEPDDCLHLDYRFVYELASGRKAFEDFLARYRDRVEPGLLTVLDRLAKGEAVSLPGLGGS